MATRGPSPPKFVSQGTSILFHCNISGHSLERCFKANPNLHVCSHCRIPGHTKEKCYKLHGFPLGHKNNFKSNFAANQSSIEQDKMGHGHHLLLRSRTTISLPSSSSIQYSSTLSQSSQRNLFPYVWYFLLSLHSRTHWHFLDT